ncbi:MAG TPA: MFS transporter [Verrucomicrobiae bacterium]|nr:MFS transporter [Verrucomicrobiae bacterium]
MKPMAGAIGALRASHVRYTILALICFLYFLSYLDRSAISVTAPAMIKEFHFNKATMGLVFSAFAFTYALLQIIGGTFGDRFGPRAVLSFLMAMWSVFTIATGAAVNFFTLFTARLLFGLGEAGGFPVSTRALASWFPKEMRGSLQGILHACSRTGGAVSPIIVVAIVAWTGSWRYAFFILGVLGIAWALVFYAMYRNSPADIPAVNRQELDYIRGSSTRPEAPQQRAIPWNQILASPDVWLLTLAYFAYGYTFWIYITWLPTYLTDARHISFGALALAVTIPLAGGVPGDLVGGWLSDYIFRRTGNLNLARRTLIAGAFIGTVVFIMPAIFVGNVAVAIVLLALAMFMLECAVSNCWAVAMDLGGQNFCGTISGFMNTGFGVAGILSPLIFGILVDRTGSWLAGFIIGSAILILGAIAIAFVNATRQVGHTAEIG